MPLKQWFIAELCKNNHLTGQSPSCPTFFFTT
jgi:hypothetical protein